ncbi:MAG TPA: NADH-quinone oxidoreductase subunit J [Aggregatilineales bacterium]|nr:NADH-quinone oxidoreductase subunit J [Aggregatilineales bacterium]
MPNVDVVQWIAFVVLSLLVLGGGLMVVADQNLFHGALWLLVCLFGVAGLFVMLSAPFLAAVQVLVYMGAIVILIIFAIMLTQKMMGQREALNDRWPVGLVMAAMAFLLTSFVLVLASNSPLLAGATGNVTGDTILKLGNSLVDTGQYALPFELASLLLTAAMIGAIVIAREEA